MGFFSKKKNKKEVKEHEEPLPPKESAKTSEPKKPKTPKKSKAPKAPKKPKTVADSKRGWYCRDCIEGTVPEYDLPNMCRAEMERGEKQCTKCQHIPEPGCRCIKGCPRRDFETMSAYYRQPPSRWSQTDCFWG
ncbi:hypothetical protein BKA64DRAFT_636938 [Cadophora sp. MPI-SDFR-AT-0126]|nr:hypothetical protein BKA64DRAFT_636938 [Leotiomycetes sp. MPI-SDFR-AT-0126]